MMLAAILQQTPIPAPNPAEQPWAWVALVCAMALGYVAKLKFADCDGWRAHAEALTEALRLNTEALGKVTTAMDAAHGEAAEANRAAADLTREVRDGFRQTEARFERLEGRAPAATP